MNIFLSLYCSTDLTAYETPLFKYLSGFSILGGFLGSKEPPPAAINIFLDLNLLFSVVITSQ